MARPRHFLLTIALFVLPALFVACGGGSDGGESPSTYAPGQKVSANNGSRADL